MSRSGYCDDIEDTWKYVCCRGAVTSALRGNRGQTFLRELLDALDAMEDKRLVTGALEVHGSFCALGVVAYNRGIIVNDPEDAGEAASQLGIANAMAREIVYMNDEYCDRLTPEERFIRMRKWVVDNIEQKPQGANNA